ncbi:MAG: hypothetical protein HYU37_22620 [Acidobacteria bacterium]|nr:hypothetical protein [Acidobacteriota bacterium]
MRDLLERLDASLREAERVRNQADQQYLAEIDQGRLTRLVLPELTDAAERVGFQSWRECAATFG